MSFIKGWLGGRDKSEPPDWTNPARLGLLGYTEEEPLLIGPWKGSGGGGVP